jgi:hypothetical protein
MTRRLADATETPAATLRSLIEPFEPQVRRRIRALRAALRKRLPTLNELVYDYGAFFVISYSPTSHPTDGIVAFAARPDGLRLYFMNGPRLPDPTKQLEGRGSQTRFLRIESASRLRHPDVESLVAAAVDLARVPPPKEGGTLVIKTKSAKSRPRRQPALTAAPGSPRRKGRAP